MIARGAAAAKAKKAEEARKEAREAGKKAADQFRAQAREAHNKAASQSGQYGTPRGPFEDYWAQREHERQRATDPWVSDTRKQTEIQQAFDRGFNEGKRIADNLVFAKLQEAYRKGMDDGARNARVKVPPESVIICIDELNGMVSIQKADLRGSIIARTRMTKARFVLMVTDALKEKPDEREILKAEIVTPGNSALARLK